MVAPVEVPVSFGVQSRKGRYGPDGSNMLLNAYAEDMGEEGKSRFVIYCSDGLRPFAEAGSGPIRALFANDTYIFALSGNTVYSITAAGTVTSLGTVSSSSGWATMARNRRSTSQISLVAGGKNYIIDGTTLSLNEGGDVHADFTSGAPLDVEFMDGRFVYSMTNGVAGRVHYSNVDDGETVAALSYFTAESDPDKLARTIRRKGELWLLGGKTSEVWTASGESDLPFRRLPGVAIDYGCRNGATVQLVNGDLYWVAHDGTVRRTQNYELEHISHSDVDDAIRKEPSPASLRALHYTARGHTYYILSGSTFTWAYDTKTGLWHEKQSYQINRWRGECCVQFGNEFYVGDYATGEVYKVDPDYGFEGADRPIAWTMRAPLIHDFPANVQYIRLDIDLVPGVGVDEEGEAEGDPKLVLRYSDDGGFTWSNERRITAGRRGETGRRLVARNLGQSNSMGRVLEISMDAGVARAVMGGKALLRRVRS